MHRMDVKSCTQISGISKRSDWRRRTIIDIILLLIRTRENDFCNLSMADSSSLIDPELVISHKFPETTYTYTER
ncbi:hypothetical protein LOK49_LG05G03849 [Camellia lanceoleosa]|uniref:Uncharacterized protein n=1 Tax=Camellia lanceoleosa TaxID=1840588 RepID=A0ACC0HSA6_9ERIC|nr:hypothetical protein LOK49_LG05G03849 [Camellia lanceoleosa]